MEAVGRSLSDAVRKMLRMPNVDEKAVKELVKDLQRALLQADVNVGLVCADTYRPGAYDQLTQLATRAEVKVYGEPGQKKPDQIAKHGLEHFRKEKMDLVIVDTAGRHKNEKDLMNEMKQIAKTVQPDEIMLAIEATSEQQAKT